MQHFNHNTIQHTRETNRTHFHEELVLQGKMTTTRSGTCISLQGPHDILMAQVEITTPAGSHTIRLVDSFKRIGTFREWDRFDNPPTPQQKKLLQEWDLETPSLGNSCKRGHKSARDFRSCNGSPRPVVEVRNLVSRNSPKPSGNKRLNNNLRFRGLGAFNRRGQTSPRRNEETDLQPSGTIYHFQASSSNPRATVQLHSPPEATPRKSEPFLVLPFPDGVPPTPPAEIFDSPNQNHRDLLKEGKKAKIEQELLTAGISEYCKSADLMEGVIKEMEKSMEKLGVMTETSQKLLDLYMCKDIFNNSLLRQNGQLQAPPSSPREQPQASMEPQGAAAVAQDPAIIVIQPCAPSPTQSIPSSMPSLESLQDPDCEITSYTPPKRRRASIKSEPSVNLLPCENGTQNLLL